MRKRDVVGRKIVDVIYERWHDPEFGHMETCEVILDNGRILRGHPYETYDQPVATLIITSTGRKRRNGREAKP